MGGKNTILTAMWLVAVLSGFFFLMKYSHTAGAAADHHEQWPSASKIARVSGKPSLVLFVHPQCDCSTATVGELEKMIPWIKEKVTTHVLFLNPSTQTDDWVQDSLWQQVKRIPYVEGLLDRNGEEARLFGAKTSGQTFLYDAEGNLIFSGGITSERGHMGDNEGSDFIISWVRNSTATQHFTPVFGCGLSKI